MSDEWGVADVVRAGEWPTEVAVERIITAPTASIASGIRTAVGLAAMQRRRPGRDFDACQAAFEDRWGNTVASQKIGTMEPVFYTGD